MTGRSMTGAIALLFVAGASLSEPFSAEKMVRLDRVGAPVVSPAGKHVVYTLRTTDMEAGKGRFDLWLSSIDGGAPRRLTTHTANDTSPAWSADGRSIYFLSTRSDSSQIWRLPVDGGEAVQVTELPVDIGTFRVAADEDRVVVSVQAFLDCNELACTAERDRRRRQSATSGVVYDRLFMRHWDHWLDEKRSRLYAIGLNNGVATGEDPVLISRIDADVPSRVWGGNEEYSLSADGRTVYFAARQRDREEHSSTNFDIYSASVDGRGPVVNLTESNPAWDTHPVLSPDGKQLAYLAMQRPGFEADRFRIMLRDLSNGRTREVAPEWDFSPAAIGFSADAKAILANANDTGNRALWRIDLRTGNTEKLVSTGHVSAFADSGDVVVFASDNLKSPTELFVLDGNKPVRQLTRFSEPQLADTEMGEFEQFSFTGAGEDTVYGYVVKPAGYRKGQQYPVAFLIHGGPQGSFGNHFHYRWNPQTYAGQGFAAVFIDFHGSTGYGQAFTDSISGDWGGKPLTDLKLGLQAALDKYGFLDGDRVCALGASYGGFMVNWIAGQWPDRFDCLVNHDGIFDNRMMYYTTEELWFPEWEHGGPYYSNPAGHEKFNPALHVDKWRTPMLVIHGELDYRIPVTQGIATFTALQKRGIASEFLYFPDENHWVLKPHNSVQWHNVVNKWLHRYLDQP